MKQKKMDVPDKKALNTEKQTTAKYNFPNRISGDVSRMEFREKKMTFEEPQTTE